MRQGSVSFRLLNSSHCPSVGEKVIIFFLEQKLVLEKNGMTKVQSPSGSRRVTSLPTVRVIVGDRARAKPRSGRG